MSSTASFLSIEERRALRKPLSTPVYVSGPDFCQTMAELVDLSTLGCRARVVLEVKVGSLLTISVPAFTSFTGWVAWTKGQEIGVDFAHPLPAPVIDHIRRLGAAAGL